MKKYRLNYRGDKFLLMDVQNLMFVISPLSQALLPSESKNPEIRELENLNQFQLNLRFINTYISSYKYLEVDHRAEKLFKIKLRCFQTNR